MIRSKTIDVTAAASAEQLEDFVSGIAAKVRTVTEIWCEHVADARLRGYLESDQIVDAGIECEQLLTNGVKVDLVLTEGQKFKAGWQDMAAGGITGEITVFYSET